MHYVYVLENEQGKHYIGSCKDLTARLKQHNQNCVCSTKNRGPYKIVYKEVAATKIEARKRENELKRSKGSTALKTLIAN